MAVALSRSPSPASWYILTAEVLDVRMPALSEQAALRARTGWLIAGALIGAVAVGVPWLLQARTSRPGRVVDLGPVDAFTSATPYPPILNARDDFYLVQKAPGEFLAFYAYPTVVRRDRPACTVIWMPMFEFDGQVGFFRDG